MSRLLTESLGSVLPRLREQEHSEDPIVYAVFYFPGSGWKWFVTEGEPAGDDFLFFGYVTGFEAEFGSFSLSELESLYVHGGRVELSSDFQPMALSECLLMAI